MRIRQRFTNRWTAAVKNGGIMKTIEIAGQEHQVKWAKSKLESFVEKIITEYRDRLKPEYQYMIQTLEDAYRDISGDVNYIRELLDSEMTDEVIRKLDDLAKAYDKHSKEYAADWYDPDLGYYRSGYPYEASVYRELSEICATGAEQTVTLQLHFNSDKELSGHLGKFEVEKLQFITDDDMVSMKYDSAVLYTARPLTFGGFDEWQITSKYEFIPVLNGYLRGSAEFYYGFGTTEWEKYFKKFKSTPDSNGLVKELYQYDDRFELYELVFATPSYRFYRHEDKYVVLHKNRHLITFTVPFSMELLREEIGKTLKGEVMCLYQSDAVTRMIEEKGKEYFGG